MRPAAVAVGALALFLAGFAVGRIQPHQPALLEVSSGPRPEVDLSPAKEPKTILAPAIKPGKPEKPPVSDPGRLVIFGEQVSTTTATLPATDAGARFHLATFAKMEANRLSLRPVAWLESPQGARLPFEASTTEAPVSFSLQTAAAPRWSASLVVLATRERIEPGAMIQHDRGPVRFTLGGTRTSALVGFGLTW